MQFLNILSLIICMSFIAGGCWYCSIGYRVGVKGMVSAALGDDEALLQEYPQFRSGYAKGLAACGVLFLVCGVAGLFHLAQLLLIIRAVGSVAMGLNLLVLAVRASLKAKVNKVVTCRIPDDHLSKRIWKLALARESMGKLLASLRTASS